MNVHAYTKMVPEGDRGNNSNHWVGVYARRTEQEVYDIKYADPMGGEISAQVRANLNQLGGEVQDITKGKPLQFGNWELQKGESENVHIFNGNQDDCGPILADLLIHIAKDQDIYKDVMSVEDSKKLGQDLRKNYNKYLDNSESRFLPLSIDKTDSITDKVEKLLRMPADKLAKTISTASKDDSYTSVNISSPDNTPQNYNKSASKSPRVIN